MGLRGRGAHSLTDDAFKRFWETSPIEGLSLDQFNFLLGKFRWTEPESPWGSERQTRAAWKKHREALIAECKTGIRPIAFWYFEKKLRPPELPWLYMAEANHRAVLRHRCWRDEAEREYCRNEIARFAAIGYPPQT
jgi:hypothetical protein